jgi:hypothetical protein
MQVPTRPSQLDVSRRQLLASGGTVLSAGGLIAVMGSRDARAQVNTTQLDIPDATHEGKDGSVTDLLLQVSGTYQYAAETVDAVELRLEVASPSETDHQAIASSSPSADRNRGNGEYSLSGSLLDHDELTADMFSADAGETVEKQLPVRVVLDVRADGSTVVSNLSSTTATVTVTNTSVEANAAVSGGGSVTIEV